MNQIFEHDIVIPEAPRRTASSEVEQVQLSKSSPMEIPPGRKFDLPPPSPRQPPVNFLTHLRLPIWLRRASPTERVSLHTLTSSQSTNKTTMSTTESLHKQCRTLESLFDNKLTAYSRLAATITRPGSHDVESTGSLERWQDLEVELEELLQKVRAVQIRRFGS